MVTAELSELRGLKSKSAAIDWRQNDAKDH